MEVGWIGLGEMERNGVGECTEKKEKVWAGDWQKSEMKDWIK
jgi:hypothetical protein